jgi:uncharacterized protein DUF397
MSSHIEYDSLDWRTATASAGGNCVEVAPLPDGGTAVRDSKDRDGAVFRFTRQEWLAFLDGLAKCEFEHLI